MPVAKASAINEHYKKNPVHLLGSPDLSELIFLEPENVLETLGFRYTTGDIYTSISDILVAINPYQVFPALYSNEMITTFKTREAKRRANSAKEGPLPPHIYLLGRKAFIDMKKTKRNQSMVICGESGSGKTESAKHVMRYLTAKVEDGTVTQAVQGSVSERVLAVNPVLEAWGNAKTVLNNNSSRFGKFTKLVYGPDHSEIRGSFIETYLLEKGRVIHQDHGEKNFHIFYLVCAIDPASDRYKVLHLRPNTEFKFLKDCYDTKESVPSETYMTEAERLVELEEALSSLQISETEQLEMFKIISAILHLGNVSFHPGKGDFATFDNAEDTETKESLDKAAELLGVPLAGLQKRLLTRSITVGKDKVDKTLSMSDANKNRGAFCKSLYSGVFDHLTRKVNSQLYSAESREDGLNWIGILDVFGFENFQHNSFEQFCINFANERLQDYFNKCIIASEQTEYVTEGLAWEPIVVPDNYGCINLIEKPVNGILAILDSACKGPKPTDLVFTQNLFKFHRYHKNMKSVNRLRGADGKFTDFNGLLVKHYAADVTYDATGWIAKSTDSTHADSQTLLLTSTFETHKLVLAGPPEKKEEAAPEKVAVKKEEPKKGGIKSRFAQFEKKNDYVSPYRRNQLARNVGSRNKKATVANIGLIFSQQLSTLMDMLQGTQPYFIRCIKPNAEKVPEQFDWNYSLPQLRCQGLIEALRILKMGYPTRTTYDLIYERYGSILSPPPANLNKRDFCEAVLRVCGEGLSRSEFQLGLTKVFFRPGQQEFLEDLLDAADDLPVATVTLIKLFLLNKRFQRVRGTVFAHVRFAKTIRKKRAVKKWYSAASTMVIINKTFLKSLKAIRLRRAAVAIQAYIRMKQAETKLRLMRQATKKIEQFVLHQTERKSLLAGLAKAKERRLERERKIAADAAAAQKAAEEKKRAEEEAAAEQKRLEKAANLRKAKEDAAFAAELARREEAERQRELLEQERLAKEAEERAERERQEQERLAKEAVEQAERDRQEAARKAQHEAELEQLRAEQEAKAQKAAEEKAALDAQLEAARVQAEQEKEQIRAQVRAEVEAEMAKTAKQALASASASSSEELKILRETNVKLKSQLVDLAKKSSPQKKAVVSSSASTSSTTVDASDLQVKLAQETARRKAIEKSFAEFRAMWDNHQCTTMDRSRPSFIDTKSTTMLIVPGGPQQSGRVLRTPEKGGGSLLDTSRNLDEDLDSNQVDMLISGLKERITVLQGEIGEYEFRETQMKAKAKEAATVPVNPFDALKLDIAQKTLAIELEKQRQRAIQSQSEGKKASDWAVRFSKDYKRDPAIVKVHEQLKKMNEAVSHEQTNVNQAMASLDKAERSLRNAGIKQKSFKESLAFNNAQSTLNLPMPEQKKLKILEVTVKECAARKVAAARRVQAAMDRQSQAVTIRDKLRDEREAKLLAAGTKKVPHLEKGKEFFMMAAISILKTMEDDDIILSAKQESMWVFKLFDIALLEGVPFYRWTDWLYERIRLTVKQRELGIENAKRRELLKNSLRQGAQNPHFNYSKGSTRQDDGCVVM